MTALNSGETVPVRIAGTEGDLIFCTLERRDDSLLVGTVLVECLAGKGHILFSGDVLQADAKGMMTIRAKGRMLTVETDTAMSLLLDPVAATFRNNFRKREVQIIGGSGESMAVVSPAELPTEGKSTLTFEDDGRVIEVEGFVTHSHKRGQGFLADFRFAQVARVTVMYWNRLLKTG